MAEDLNNIKLMVSYEGTRYHGWQRQPNGLTVQEIMEEKIRTMVGEAVRLIASGRTDAGVHAVGQVCNFKTRSRMDPHILRRGLNALLPSDIWITHAERTPPQFHARYSAKGKIYEYRILNRTEPDIFARRCLWHIKEALDAEEMARCLSLLRGTHDFSAFRASGSGNVNPVRCVTQAALHGPEDGLLRVVMEADGFLRHMVRNIVGTVVEVGKGRMDYERFKQVFASKDRRLAGIKAPPQGLFLMNVQY